MAASAEQKTHKIKLLENDSTTRKPQLQTPDTHSAHSEDLYELYKDAQKSTNCDKTLNPK